MEQAVGQICGGFGDLRPEAEQRLHSCDGAHLHSQQDHDEIRIRGKINGAAFDGHGGPPFRTEKRT